MSQIGTMGTTAGETLTLNLPYTPQFISVGNTYSGTLELTNFSVSINGQETINLVGADNIDAVGQARRQVNSQDGAGGAGLPYTYLEITDGFISAPTLIRLTNEGTTANIVYGVSKAVGTAPYRYSQFTVNATSNQEFSDFDSILLNDSASIDSVEYNGLTVIKIDTIIWSYLFYLVICILQIISQCFQLVVIYHISTTKMGILLI